MIARPSVPTLFLPISASLKTQPAVPAVGSPVLLGFLKEHLELAPMGWGTLTTKS